jgi:HEAT repeat protein
MTRKTRSKAPARLSPADAAALVKAMSQVKGVALVKLREAVESAGAAGLKPLLKALKAAPRHQVRWEAAKALAHLADPRATGPLILALDDPDADVGRVAAEALAAIGPAAHAHLFRALARHPEHRGLREGVRHVLRAGRPAQVAPYRPLLAAIERGRTHEAAAVAAVQAFKLAQGR